MPTQHPRKGFESRIRECYEQMTPAERRLADLLLGFPGSLAGYSATELAQMAGISKAVSTRLFRKLGYGGFDEFRRELRGARQWGSPIYQGEPGRGAEATLAPHGRHEDHNLRRSLQRIDPRQLATAVEALRGA
ncbi:MAG: hypothetical protein R3202_03645, partial [Candidatus Competibacterales bacterium]|nr:hypothetical protein [Candidatus Competibacterales bacterium]